MCVDSTQRGQADAKTLGDLQLDIEEAFEESFRELGLDLDGDTDDILSVTDESDETPEAEDEPKVEESVDEQTLEEDAPENVDEPNPDAVRIDIPDGAILRLPDGTEVDSKQAVLLQRDYTKKTQQLADERREFEEQRQEVADAYEQMRTWYEERSADPTAWVQEIVASTEDPTATIAKALYELANQGKLDPSFVSAFGIDAGEVAERAQQTSRDTELEALKRKVEEREQAEAAQARVREQAAVYQRQWDEIKSGHALAFDSADAEREAKKELLTFAVESGLSHSLTDAYDLMLVRTGRFNPQSAQQPKGDPAVAAKKRASRAVTQRSESAAGGGTKTARPRSTREAALEAISEFAASR